MVAMPGASALEATPSGLAAGSVRLFPGSAARTVTIGDYTLNIDLLDNAGSAATAAPLDGVPTRAIDGFLINLGPVSLGLGTTGAPARPSLDHGFESEGRRLFTSVALGDALGGSLALTGTLDLGRGDDVGTALGFQEDASDARLGIRFSTRAGDQLLLVVEPSLTTDAGFDADPAVATTQLGLGAGATYDFSPNFFVSGVARIEQTLPSRSDGRDGSTSVVGGFVTGYRF